MNESAKYVLMTREDLIAKCEIQEGCLRLWLSFHGSTDNLSNRTREVIGAKETACKHPDGLVGGYCWICVEQIEPWKPETSCEACEGSGETGHTHHDGTQYSDHNPPCVVCGGSGKVTSKKTSAEPK